MRIQEIAATIRLVMTDMRVLMAAIGFILFLTLFFFLADGGFSQFARRPRRKKDKAPKSKIPASLEEGAEDDEKGGEKGKRPEDAEEAEEGDEKAGKGKKKVSLPNPFGKKSG
jgi:hypothetical protein